MRLPLFESEESRPDRLGHAAIEYRDASSILTPASGFMGGYDFTLNPYSGCSFGCTYCYAAFFARDIQLRDQWGYWVHVKENAVGLLRRMRTDLRGKTIYMSSVTDPYQPIERSLGLVREILIELLNHQPRLVIQTRSPHVTRDIDLFLQFNVIQVNMTVTTDSERVRKAFEPMCPSNDRRLDAIAEVASRGVRTAVTMTPLLPLEDPVAFASRIRATNAAHFVVQPFHREQGKFVRGTRTEAMALFREMRWDDQAYASAVALLRSQLVDLHEGQSGFAPL
jgi:DNA repair photolyase